MSTEETLPKSAISTESQIDAEDKQQLKDNAVAKSPTDLEEKIIKQIEYYFGDFNLNRDKFLKEQIKSNDEGWVSLEVLTTFTRLKALSTNFEEIASALEKSRNELIEVHSDGTKVRRSAEKPIPEHDSDHDKQLKERCVYVKKFSEDVTLDELQDFFKTYGKVENITMRKLVQTKQFRGSIFLTFSTKEEADKFLNLTSVKYKGNELSRESKDAYIKRKEKQIEKSKEQKEKKLKNKEAIQAEMQKENEQERNEEKIVKGCILKLSGLCEGLDWEALKAIFSKFAAVAYVDFRRGQTEGLLRFVNEGDAKLALEKALESNEEKKLIIREKEVSANVLEGEEELSYWEKFNKIKAERYQKFQKRGRRGRYNKYDNRNRSSQKKKQSEESVDEPAPKIQKIDI